VNEPDCLALIARLNKTFSRNQLSDEDAAKVVDVARSYPNSIVEQVLRQLMSARFDKVSASAFRFRIGHAASSAAGRSQARRDAEDQSYVPATRSQAARWQAVIAFIQTSEPGHPIRALNAKWARSNQGHISDERALRMLAELEQCAGLT
jgi:hypothetical protein